MYHQSSRSLYKLFISLFLGMTLLGATACKETKATHPAGLLETCKALSDQKKWTDAIAACTKVTTDEGKHLAAQAYMGRAGLSLFGMLTALGGAADPTSLILTSIPSTAAKAKDYRAALEILMENIATPTDTTNLEALLLSSMLVYKELSALFDLKVVNGVVTNCGSGGTLEGCPFAFSITTTTSYASGLTFTGLGTAFYEAICQDPASSTAIATTASLTHKVTNFIVSLSQPLDVNYTLTINGCTAQPKSNLAYNQAAGAAIVGFTDLATSLAKLKIFSEMDKGLNFAQSASDLRDPIKLCNTGFVEPPIAGDGILNDCEVLGYFNPP